MGYPQFWGDPIKTNGLKIQPVKLWAALVCKLLILNDAKLRPLHLLRESVFRMIWGGSNFGETPYTDPQNGQTYHM